MSKKYKEDWTTPERINEYFAHGRGWGRVQYLEGSVEEFFDEVNGNSVIEELMIRYDLYDIGTCVSYILFMSNDECRGTWAKLCDKPRMFIDIEPKSDLLDIALLAKHNKLKSGVDGFERIEKWDVENWKEFSEKWQNKDIAS
jgi:hypothetical protein